MIIKQGANDAKALTSTIGVVVVSSITMIGVRAIVTLVLIPLTRVVIVITRMWVVGNYYLGLPDWVGPDPAYRL